MKKLFVLAVSAFFMFSLYAQEGTTVVLLNYNTLEKKVEKSNEDIQHPKKKLKYKTWIKRGELFQDVFMYGLEQTQEGMTPTTLKIFYKEPLEVETEDKDGQHIEKYIYEHMIYTFVNGALQQWEKRDPIVEDPLHESMISYMKALDLDEKGKVPDKIRENLVELKNQMKRDGVNNYYSGNYDKALADFENVLQINNLDMFKGEFDTTMVQYSGIIAREIAGKTDNKDLYLKAIDYYNQLADVGYGGPNTYLQIKMDWMAVGDTMKALEVLKEAYEKYPDTVNIIANIADTYIQLHKIDEGLDFMEKVIENNPKIAEAYYWQGRLLINKEDAESIEKAIESYKKAGELKPDLYYVWYDLGYIYYLQGADYYERANEETHEPTRKRLLELGKEKYQAAIPVLEKAMKLNVDQNTSVRFETLDLLQRIYYKEQMMDQYERVKAMKSEMQ